MCYPFLFIRFLFPCHWFARIPFFGFEEHALPDQTRAGFLFNLIRNPCGYQYIGISPFPDPFHFAKSHTNLKHHRDWKTQTLSTKFWSRPRLFSFIPSSELQTKKKRSQIDPQQLHGSANSSIELLSTTICKSPWMNVCPTLTSAHDFLKNRTPPKKIFPIPRKPQILKKYFRINIIANISKPRIKSSANGFRQIS